MYMNILYGALIGLVGGLVQAGFGYFRETDGQGKSVQFSWRKFGKTVFFGFIGGGGAVLLAGEFTMEIAAIGSFGGDQILRKLLEGANSRWGKKVS